MASIIERIQEVASQEGGDDELLATAAPTHHPELWEDALDAYGTWDAALIASLCDLVQKKARTSAAKDREEGAIQRLKTAAAREPVYVVSDDGTLFWIDGEELDVTDAPEFLPPPEDAGPMRSFSHIGTSDGVFLFSNLGRFFGVDPRLVPQWMGESPVRDMGQILPLQGGESIRFVLPRKAMYEGRIIHITRDAKGKASEVSEIGRTLDRTGKEAFLLNDDDVPVAVLAGPTKNGVFCASAMGQGIHFDADDMRSMGRKAVGVNVMKLDGDDDSVVSAFLTNEVEQVAVITKFGWSKRLWFDEFRQQGRGGGGMQVCKLDPGDTVVAVVPCVNSEDLVVSTSHGRVWRFATTELEIMGRPARGNRIFEMEEGEFIIGLAPLPCGSNE